MGRTRLWAFVWAGVAAGVLSGCAATGVSYVSVSSTLPTLKADSGRVFFYRSDSMLGAAIQPDIRLDHQVVGKSQPGGFFYVDTHPGRHLATSQTEVEARLEFDVGAGQTVYVASSIGFGLLAGRVQLNLQPEAMAKAELSALRYTGSGAATAQSSVAPVTPRPAASPPAASPPAGGASPRGRVTMADLDALLPAPTTGGTR